MLKKFKIKVNGNQYDVEVEEVDKKSGKINNEIKEEKKEYKSLKAQRPETMFDSIIRGNSVDAPINGTVMNILVSENEKVHQGDILLILEAMKMENEITSPADGKIEKICVKKGDKVDTGEILIELS